VFEKYSGVVKLVYKNFPLRYHRQAFMAAVYALAAYKQNKFWEFHDELYENNRHINEETLTQIADKIGLSQILLYRDIRDPKLKERIILDYKEGVAAGVRGIPTAFVNGKLLRNRSLEGLQTAIEKELEKNET
jgi:protein-disulfide isomerase